MQRISNKWLWVFDQVICDLGNIFSALAERRNAKPPSNDTWGASASAGGSYYHGRGGGLNEDVSIVCQLRNAPYSPAEGGTILLDEMGEMPSALQAKLLHVLQGYTYSRLGSRTSVRVNVRVLAATNVNVEEAIATKKLREDLYYRLNGFTFNIPSLRERKKEIPILLRHFMLRVAERYGRAPAEFSPRLLHTCLAYPCRGNLRELENFVRRSYWRDEELALTETAAERLDAGPKALPAASGQDLGLKSLARW